MDRIYFNSVKAAGELQQLLIFVAMKRDYIGECSYEEADRLKLIHDSIEQLKQEAQAIIGDQLEYIARTE